MSKPAKFRPLRSTNGKCELIVDTEFGYKIYYEVEQRTLVDIENDYPGETPDFYTDANLKFIKVEKIDNAAELAEIRSKLSTRSIVDQQLEYQTTLLGFVYADDSNLNNHRWFLDFRQENESVYVDFCDEIVVKSPIETVSWFENEIWHGRFSFPKNSVEMIREPSPGIFEIVAKQKTNSNFNIDLANNNNLLLADVNFLRFRFNIFKNLWYCDMLDGEENEISIIECNDLYCNVEGKGVVKQAKERPRVSLYIDASRVGKIILDEKKLYVLSNESET